MRKISVMMIAVTLFFAACENTGSSTVDTYDKTDAYQSENKEEAPPYVDTSREFAGSSVTKDSTAATGKKDAKIESPTKDSAKH